MKPPHHPSPSDITVEGNIHADKRRNRRVLSCMRRDLSQVCTIIHGLHVGVRSTAMAGAFVVAVPVLAHQCMSSSVPDFPRLSRQALRQAPSRKAWPLLSTLKQSEVERWHREPYGHRLVRAVSASHVVRHSGIRLTRSSLLRR